MRIPTQAQIDAQALAVIHAVQHTCAEARQVKVACRAFLLRPSTLAIAAGLAVLYGFRHASAHLHRPDPKPVSGGLFKAAAAFISARLMRNGWAQIVSMLRESWRSAQRATPATTTTVPPQDARASR